MFVPVALVKVTAPRFVRPVTAKLVVVAFVPLRLVKEMLVPVALLKVRMPALRLVVVTLVPTAVAKVSALARFKLVPEALVKVTRPVLKLVVVAEPKMRRLPEAETLPTESAKKRPFKLEVEVAIKIPSARRLEVVEPSETVTAVEKALEATPPVASAPQENLPVVALYKTV